MKEIYLSKGHYTKVDNEDYDWLMLFNWHVHESKRSSGIYASTSINDVQNQVLMHRLIMNPDPYTDVDHRDGNGLNNQKSNLRLATKQQQNQNARKRYGTSSRFKGVTWDKQRGKWRAKIVSSYRNIYIGLFDNETDAARAYNDMAKKLFGEFAWLNEIGE